WTALLEKHALPPPPAIRPRQVQQLQEVYTKTEALEPLLKAQSALDSTANIFDRIALLKKLRALKPDDLELKAQLADLEKARQNDTRNPLQARGRQLSTFEIETIIRELSDSVAVPPPDLKAAAERLLKESRRRNDVEALKNLFARLQSAFTGKDLN